MEGKGREGKGREGKGREGKGREGKGREGKGREGKGREGKGREGKGREGKGREGKGRVTRSASLRAIRRASLNFLISFTDLKKIHGERDLSSPSTTTSTKGSISPVVGQRCIPLDLASSSLRW